MSVGQPDYARDLVSRSHFGVLRFRPDVGVFIAIFLLKQAIEEDAEKYITSENGKVFMVGLKPVYKAVNKETAGTALPIFREVIIEFSSRIPDSICGSVFDRCPIN